MAYFNTKTVGYSFELTIEKVTEKLKTEGFGVLTEIDVQATLKKKLDVDFRKYKILGACNPPFAHKALLAEPNIGVLLPCNIVIQEAEEGRVRVSVVNPMDSMSSVQNEELGDIANEISAKLRRVLEEI